MRTSVVPRLRSQRGFTLVELIAVMAIFMSVVTGLTMLFISGARAELDANERFEAQQNARLALDKLRRELHCSSGITNPDGSALGLTPVAAIRVVLPAHCPSADGVEVAVLYEMVSAGTGRWKLRRTKDGVPVDVADHFTNDDAFTYTAQSDESRATLHVELPVNVTPNEGSKTWRLVDDIVLRNTLREAA
ncbi:MAG TPA: prepilin-type N-terminal cleavage/methylation domain-containing protein [Gaiellaceae bacterium]|nr:prepilin-type N-terminal cleavage/methylation domain-containing protein [Gaiellaceae bacterium]